MHLERQAKHVLRAPEKSPWKHIAGRQNQPLQFSCRWRFASDRLSLQLARTSDCYQRLPTVRRYSPTGTEIDSRFDGKLQYIDTCRRINVEAISIEHLSPRAASGMRRARKGSRAVAARLEFFSRARLVSFSRRNLGVHRLCRSIAPRSLGTPVRDDSCASVLSCGCRGASDRCRQGMAMP